MAMIGIDLHQAKTYERADFSAILIVGRLTGSTRSSFAADQR